MALLGREFIAVPDDRKGQIVFKWPDITIRRFTRAIVNADEMALFVNTGQVVQTMGPGRHQIDANELPGLGVVIDSITGGNAYRAELYFVGTREYTGFKFGGRVDDVQDPRTGLVVTLRVFGDYALRVADPVRLVTNMTATVDVTDNERIAGWVSDQLLKVLRTHVTTQIIRNGWPILGLMAYSAEIEQATIDAASIDTRVEKRDTHLKSPDFLDVARYPTIVFVSKKVEAGAPGHFKVIGDLTLHGVTREVSLDVEGPTPEIKDPRGNTRAGAQATTTINRKDFGLTWNQVLETGGVAVGDEVTITIDVEATKQTAAGG